ncbi:MAG: shikimate dehydrogenase, partial [Candidatus Gastranaerophilaceae bacterium]
MHKLGILGYPLGHSLSPFMHNAALKNLGLSGSYEKLEYPPEELENAVKFIKNNGFSGINVTIPFKIDILKYLDEIDSAAEAVGSVNTLKISKEGKITGYNTDVYGFLNAFDNNTVSETLQKTAAIIGNGGAARAVMYALVTAGFKNINIYARNTEKSEELAQAFSFCHPALDAGSEKWRINTLDLKQKATLDRSRVSARDDILGEERAVEGHVGKVDFCEQKGVEKSLSRDDIGIFKALELTYFIDLTEVFLLVNTTPLGMYGKFEGISPVSLDSLKTMPANGIVYDIVYKPEITKLLEYSKLCEL